MTQFVVLIVLSSTVMHAGWNLIIRQQRRSAARVIFRAHVLVAVIGLVPAVVAEFLSAPLPMKAWGCVVGSGACCAVYYFGLARGYGRADFTVVYPVVRALPVLLVGLCDILRGRFPTSAGWAGMALVSAGCFLAPRRSLREFRLRDYFHESSLWMLLAALGTVGYTMLDKVAAEAVQAVQPGPLSAARYGYVFFVASFAFFALVLHLFKADPTEEEDVGWRRPFWCALMNFGAYWLVLWAYQLAERASYIVAFRQASIVIGVVAAFAIYKEPGKLVRITAALLITAGLLTIALWGR